MTKNLKVYINNRLYKTITVEADENGHYDSKPIMEQLISEKDAGLLELYNVSSKFGVRLTLV